jgi:hypothetical protein
VRYKFAFQWCESQGEPWWLKQSNMDTGSRKNDILLSYVFIDPQFRR